MGVGGEYLCNCFAFHQSMELYLALSSVDIFLLFLGSILFFSLFFLFLFVLFPGVGVF